MTKEKSVNTVPDGINTQETHQADLQKADAKKLSNYTYYGFNKQIVADAMTSHMSKITDDLYYMIDEIMNRHDAEFIVADEKPELGLSEDQYADTEMYFKAHLEVMRQLIGYLWQCLPPIIERYEAPFILPHQLVQEHTKHWFDCMVQDTHDAREKLWKEHCFAEMQKEVSTETDPERKKNFERIMKDYQREIDSMKIYEVEPNNGQ